LDDFPSLKAANDQYKIMKQSFNDGQLAQFFAKRGSGESRVQPELFFNRFINGTAKKANSEQVKSALDNFDPSGETQRLFVGDLRKSYQASLAARLERVQGDKGLPEGTFKSWLASVKPSMQAYDSQFGTSFVKDFSNPIKSIKAAKDAQLDLNTLEKTGFAHIANGEIDNTINNAISNNTLKPLVDSMPNKFLKDAVAKRAAGKIIDMDNRISSPKSLLPVIRDNKQLLQTAIGKDGLVRLSKMMNLLAKIEQTSKGSALDEARKRLIQDKETTRKTLNLVTAVIGSVRRRAFKIGQAIQEGDASKRTLEAFLDGTTNPTTMKRLLRIARNNPDSFRNMWLLATVPPTINLANNNEVK